MYLRRELRVLISKNLIKEAASPDHCFIMNLILRWNLKALQYQVSFTSFSISSFFLGWHLKAVHCTSLVFYPFPQLTESMPKECTSKRIEDVWEMDMNPLTSVPSAAHHSHALKPQTSSAGVNQNQELRQEERRLRWRSVEREGFRGLLISSVAFLSPSFCGRYILSQHTWLRGFRFWDPFKCLPSLLFNSFFRLWWGRMESYDRERYMMN